jgi:recombination endonuclease VII
MRTKPSGKSGEKFDHMYCQQQGFCPICAEPFSKDEMHVDHDHKTQKVRALLCRKCNLGLGYFQDTVASLLRAADYIRVHLNPSA